MSDPAQIEVVISKNGKVTLTVTGVKGPSCTTLTPELADALGITIRDVHTSDYGVPVTQKVQKRVSVGSA